MVVAHARSPDPGPSPDQGDDAAGPSDDPIVVVMVEDDPVTRMIGVAALENAGITVIEGENADDAIAIFESQGAQAHVLFTDVDMGGTMNGVMLAHVVRQIRPTIGLLVATAHFEPRTVLPEGSCYLRKPYDLATVVQHIRILAAASR
jgi:CheY-like chemotaxis protein